jgi:Flp pilus assembly protein TadD/type IV secretory pathway TrbD component
MPDPSSRPNRSVLIANLSRARDWSRVLDVALEGLAEEPGDARLHGHAATALVNLQRYDEAEVHVRKALAGSPNNGFYHRLLSMVCFHLKRFREADEAIRRALELNPDDSNHWYHLAKMAHDQGDHGSALKWATKARELDPNNANILNLCAICVRDSGEKEQMLREALALDPQNPFALTNLGSHYLGVAKDYPQAERCFREALAINPGLKLARRGLFMAIQRRDLIYRILSAPRNFLGQFRSTLLKRGESSLAGRMAGAVFGVLCWILFFRFVAAAFLLWLALVWPLLKVYEFLVIGDIRAKAGDVGARKGGILGYRRWPIQVRLGVFGAALLTFWGGIFALFYSNVIKPGADDPIRDERVAAALGVTILLVILVLFVKIVRSVPRRFQAWLHRRRLKNFQPTPP